MNSYTKMLKQAEAAYKRKQREEKRQLEIDRKKQEAKNMEMYAAMIREEKQEAEKQEKERKIQLIFNHDYLQNIANSVNYKTWLLYRDILYAGYMQIEEDLIKGKITKQEVDQALNFLLGEKAITAEQKTLIEEMLKWKNTN